MSIMLSSSRFGAVEVDPAAVIEFPDGLIGLGGTRYALLATSAETPFLWLHSLDQAALALPVTNPHRFFADFRLEMLRTDAELLGIDDSVSVDVYVTIRATGESGPGRPPAFVANLRAPIAVHGGVGLQVINQAPGMELRARLPLAARAQAEVVQSVA